MGPEILIPAAIGAVGSGAMGGDPIKGALLGGATGGLFSGAGGLFGGAGATGATTGIQLAQPAITEGFSTALAPAVVGGGGGAGITGLGTQALGGAGITGLGSGTLGAGGAAITGLNTIPLDTAVNYNNLSRLAVDTPLTFGERLSDLGSNTMSYAQQNPMTVLSGGQSLLDIRQKNEQADKQRLQEAVAMGNQQIRKGQSSPMTGNLLQVKRIG
jgi:hypothetical protein